MAILTITTMIVAFATAHHWTKTDRAESPETFHTETYTTGLFIVTDTGGNPCYVGQDWYECRNEMVDEFNRECAERQLTAPSDALCDRYVAEIDRMEQVGTYGSIVASLGGYGYLRSAPESAQRSVSNNDYRPAVTHDAVCYLGFLGECEERAPTTASDSAAVEDEVRREIDDAVEVVNAFWASHFSEFYGVRYTTPAVGGLYRSTMPPVCGGEELEAFNAFYCVPDDTLWWDSDLMSEAYAAGDAVVYLIVAHEWGHAIQTRSGDIWVAAELQADCLAAAALYGAGDDGSFEWEAGDTAEITSALTALADLTPWTTTSDHGDPLDRIDAFNDGRLYGVEGCFALTG